MGALTLPIAACGGGLPRPPFTQVRAEDYVPVPQPPQVPIVEIVPARPARAVRPLWIDGGWEWSGARYRWRSGGWIDGAQLPEGARYAPWAIVRRREDGQLFFAPSTLRDPAGASVPMPVFLARAESSPGEVPTVAPDARPPGVVRAGGGGRSGPRGERSGSDTPPGAGGTGGPRGPGGATP